MRTANPHHHHPLAAAIALALSGSAGAANITVDGAKCTLVDAITAANRDRAVGGCGAGNAADALNLTAPVYTLNAVNNTSKKFGPNALPVVSSVITIEGDPDGDGRGVVVQRSGAAGTKDFRLFYVSAGGDLSVNRVTLRNGRASSGAYSSYGGALLNHKAGSVTLANSTLSANTTAGSGGSLFSDGNVKLISTTVSGNTGRGCGGLSSRYGSLTLIRSTVSGNSADRYGGGLCTGETTLLIDSTISGNSALYGGGIRTGGILTLTRSTVSGNSASYKGGGIDNGSRITLIQSTVSGNRSDHGGGIFNDYGSGGATLTDSTVSGNSASFDGGGIFNWNSPLTLTRSTISGNASQRGGGLANWYKGVTTLSNNLVANSPSGGDCVNNGGVITHKGVNLIEDGSCKVADKRILTGDPKLGPLIDNGGPTFTHAPLAGSPAIDKADGALCKKADQRGAKRPQGAHCDIGAFERILNAAPKIKPILGFFDQATAQGDLVGTGGTAGEKGSRLEAVRNQVLLAGDYTKPVVTPKACQQLKATRTRIDADGTPDKNDYVTGTAARDLAGKIIALGIDLGCR